MPNDEGIVNDEIPQPDERNWIVNVEKGQGTTLDRLACDLRDEKREQRHGP
jgi:hypothetical protein